MPEKGDIPFGAQFSPEQIDLARVIQIIHEKPGNRGAMVDAIREEFFAGNAEGQRNKIAGNTVIALKTYKLLDDNFEPTPIAQELAEISIEDDLYKRFAKHILEDLNGIILVETIIAMQKAGERIELNSLARCLEERGIHVPRGSVSLSSMRLWLAKAGIFKEKRIYEVNETCLEEILGTNLDAIDRISSLTKPQRDFLRALRNIPGPGPFLSNEVADLAKARYNTLFNYKNLPKTILASLVNLDYITINKSTEGRGAKPYSVLKTEKFSRDITEPILRVAEEKSGLLPKELFEMPLSQILEELQSPNTYVKGRALELLVIYIARLVDLELREWRKRSIETGGAEVDVIFEGSGLIFGRWQIQAKNTTSRVPLGDVAKEVGLSQNFLHSNVLMIVTTSDFTEEAYEHVNMIMKNSNFNIILLTGEDLAELHEDPARIVYLLNAKAKKIMKLKEFSS